jgi:hypothetical protein
MKKYGITIILSFTITMTVGYLLMSFKLWDINPKNWGQEEREVYIISFIVYSAVVSAIMCAIQFDTTSFKD